MWPDCFASGVSVEVNVAVLSVVGIAGDLFAVGIFVFALSVDTVVCGLSSVDAVTGLVVLSLGDGDAMKENRESLVSVAGETLALF